MHPTLVEGVRPPSVVQFTTLPAAPSPPGTRTWYGRTEHLVLAYIEAQDEVRLQCGQNDDEQTLILPDTGARARVMAGHEDTWLEGRCIAIVPPGETEIVLPTQGRIVRVMTARSVPQLAACAANAAVYHDRDDYVTDLEPWPAPPNGFRVRQYGIERLPMLSGTTGWMFRSTNQLISWGYGHNGWTTRSGADEVVGVGAHSHEDFEQIMLLLHGTLRVHLRVPWTLDSNDWVPDMHVVLTPPAFVAVPPRVIHVADGNGVEIGIWCPPRRDWAPSVLNRDEYPLAAPPESRQPVDV